MPLLDRKSIHFFQRSTSASLRFLRDSAAGVKERVARQITVLLAVLLLVLLKGLGTWEGGRGGGRLEQLSLSLSLSLSLPPFPLLSLCLNTILLVPSCAPFSAAAVVHSRRLGLTMASASGCSLAFPVCLDRPPFRPSSLLIQSPASSPSSCSTAFPRALEEAGDEQQDCKVHGQGRGNARGAEAWRFF